MVVLNRKNPCPPGFKLIDGICVIIPRAKNILGIQNEDPFNPEPEPQPEPEPEPQPNPEP